MSMFGSARDVRYSCRVWPDLIELGDAVREYGSGLEGALPLGIPLPRGGRSDHLGVTSSGGGIRGLLGSKETPSSSSVTVS